MSIHLVECALRVVGIRAGEKLVLIGLAEKCRDDGRGPRHSDPGHPWLQTSSMLSASRVSEALRSLVELQIIELHKKGRRNVGNAVWALFPNGCCERHGLDTAPEHSEPDATPKRTLSAAQLDARRTNVNRIAARARAAQNDHPDNTTGSELQEPEHPVNNPTVRSLTQPQDPKNPPQAPKTSASVSEGSDAPRTYLLPEEHTDEVQTQPNSPRAPDSDDDLTWPDIATGTQ